jgi:quinol monooxygenase YgiN
MEVDRREFLKGLSAAAILIAPAGASPQGAHDVYGLIAKLIAAPGLRDELMAILLEGTREMPGCLAYIVAKDLANENAIWITEIWDSEKGHDASLTLPSVRSTIEKGRPLIAGFEKVAVTSPVGGVGFPSANAH